MPAEQEGATELTRLNIATIQPLVKPQQRGQPSWFPDDPHRYREVGEATLSTWASLKAWNAEIATDLLDFGPVLSSKLQRCQNWMRFRWLENGHPGIYDVKRCQQRAVCPVCQFARQRSLNQTIDLFARELVGDGDLFVSFMARGDLDQHAEAVKWMRDSWAWRKHTEGALIGRHLSPDLVPHSHGYLETNLSPQQIAELWKSACKAAGMTHARTHCEEVRNPPAAICYILRPFRVSGCSPQTLVEAHQTLKGKRLHGFTGSFREYWKAAREEAEANRPDWKETSRPLGYEWKHDKRAYQKIVL